MPARAFDASKNERVCPSGGFAEVGGDPISRPGTAGAGSRHPFLSPFHSSMSPEPAATPRRISTVAGRLQSGLKLID